MTNRIEHLTCPNGDWEALKLNDRLFYDGHSIPSHVWLDLLQQIDTTNAVSSEEISDEDMERGNY